MSCKSMDNFRVGFIQDRSYLTDYQLSQIIQALVSNKQDIIGEYERRMAGLIGGGWGLSFASGRMAFFSLLKVLNLSPGDEIILPGFTCSVMVNAIWRAGARPVFADIDRDTFGSSFPETKKKITSRTRVIVVQHSFGIPCDIAELQDFSKERGILVVEDCALTFDTAIGGITVGNLADAAIFSTDHTKPINTVIGGLFYTRNKQLYDRIMSYSKSLPELGVAHQKRLYRQLILEREISMLDTSSNLRRLLSKIKRKLLHRYGGPVFLEDDYARNIPISQGYPYPARMPAFLAQAGIFELERWKEEKERRKRILERYMEIMSYSDSKKYIPKVYFNQRTDIAPLRFVFEHPNSIEILRSMSGFIDISKIWFRSPIVCCSSLQNLGYRYGECPVAEEVGQHIINWPCNVPPGFESNILGLFERTLQNN